MKTETVEKPKKLSFFKSWKTMKVITRIYIIFIHLFALCGAAAIGAWAIYTIGLTKNGGVEDPFNRHLSGYQSLNLEDSSQIYKATLQNYLKINTLERAFPLNAKLISQATEDPEIVNQMLYYCGMYFPETPQGQAYQKLQSAVDSIYSHARIAASNENVIPWMNDPGWPTLRPKLAKDAEKIRKAAEITGVDARLIAACTVGEQIRLFNSRSEDFKRRAGFTTMSVQSQFSLGVNGIKDFTAAAVERNLKDSTSVFYMGKKYEHILDYTEAESADKESARFNRLVDYHNNLYSYIYTGCILHQTMMQWKRAGYDLSKRPDILFTLFNLGFPASKPNPEPKCGGSRISVGGRDYTFGRIGVDFFYSGELVNEFPMQKQLFQE